MDAFCKWNIGRNRGEFWRRTLSRLGPEVDPGRMRSRAEGIWQAWSEKTGTGQEKYSSSGRWSSGITWGAGGRQLTIQQQGSEVRWKSARDRAEWSCDAMRADIPRRRLVPRHSIIRLTGHVARRKTRSVSKKTGAVGLSTKWLGQGNRQVSDQIDPESSSMKSAGPPAPISEEHVVGGCLAARATRCMDPGSEQIEWRG
jgi:hypothetical protein